MPIDNNTNSRRKNFTTIDQRDWDEISNSGVCNHSLLSREEEAVLSEKILEGCKVSLEKLIKSNLKLVVSIAQSYVTNRMTLGDCVSIGSIGLHNAAKRYDAKRGTRFSTYASWHIRETLREAFWLQRSPLIHVPTNMQGLYKDEREGKEIPEAAMERLDKAKLCHDNFSDITRVPTDLHPTVEDDGSDSDKQELIVEVLAHYNLLMKKDKELLGRRFGIGGYPQAKSLKELAKLYGISPEAIRQRQERALDRLRALLQEKEEGD